MRVGLQGNRWSLLLLAALATPGWAGTPLPDGPHIVVTGQGKASAKPDQVSLTFRFESRSTQPLPAKQAVDAAVARMLKLLPTFGITEQDVQAGSLDASEDVDYTDSGKRVSNGFEASRDVTVLLKDIERVNDLIDAGLAAGASGFRNLDFQSSRADELREQARRKAADDARAKAAASVQNFGASLGAMYSIGSVNSREFERYGESTLDSVTVTGGRVAAPGRYLQPSVEFNEIVQVVFDVKR